MRVHIYHKSAFEEWDWRTPETTGIGGSETAQVEISRGLSRLGFDVTCYANTPADLTDDGAVKWRHWREADFSEIGHWIIFRQPNALDNHEPHMDQEFSLLCQDVVYNEACGGAFTEERTRKFKRIVGLCKTHCDYLKRAFPFMADKVVQSTNGIKTDAISRLTMPERDNFRVIWASSPDRGLECLLKIFRRARQQEPRLSLHCFYGFDNWDKVISAAQFKSKRCISRDTFVWDMASGIPITADFQYEYGKPSCTQETMKANIVKLLDQPGVTWHGRINQPQLWDEFSKSGFWCYPTWFAETSAIVCLEAQALGAIPITTPYWAVGENVQHGVFIHGDPTHDKLLQARYADWLVKLAGQPRYCDDIRRNMMPWARARFNWSGVAFQWAEWIGKEMAIPCS